MISLSKTQEQLSNEVMGKISLSKDKEVLGGSVVNLSKIIIDLSKEKQIDIGSVVARVIVAIDVSGSMVKHCESGSVQKVINTLIPIGLTFDDDGTIPSYGFDDKFKRMVEMTLSNYCDYVDTVIMRESEWGGTNYRPVLEAILLDQFGLEVYNGKVRKAEKSSAGGDGKGDKGGGLLGKLFGKKAKEKPKVTSLDTQGAAEVDDTPVFVIYITDGGNWDRKETMEFIRATSGEKWFIQFIGVNDKPNEFEFLEQFDDLDGRVRDNTGFERFDSFESMTDVAVYNAVLSQFADWLKEI